MGAVLANVALMCMKYEGIDEQFADRLVVYSENLCNAHLILSRDECISSGARRRMPRLLVPLQRTPKHSSATAAEEYIETFSGCDQGPEARLKLNSTTHPHQTETHEFAMSASPSNSPTAFQGGVPPFAVG